VLTVSDADRAAARELFVAGVGAQQAGRFAEALDKFERAQSVFQAPTHLLHIAECEAALGKLVESAETYRTLARTQLPQGAPNAFVVAQQQGGAELMQVEPRIPAFRLVVKPDNVPNVQVLLDGQAMSAALVGVQRPADPGTHTITVTAPGYARADQSFALKEREQRDVVVTLQPGGAPGPAVVYVPPPNQDQLPPPPGVQGAEPPTPPPYDQQQPPEYQGSVKHESASTGIMVGPTIGLLAPGGAFASNSSISPLIGGGVALGLEGGVRFAKRWYIGLVYTHGVHGKGTSIDGFGSQVPSGDSLTTNANSNYIGLDFVYISNPDGVAFYGELGLGYRSLNAEYQTATTDASHSYTGGEGLLGVGIHVKVSEWFRMVPKLTIAAGQFSKYDCSQTGPDAGLPGGLACNAGPSAPGSNITNTDTHSFALLGITGYFDFARKR
jgi:hypothetical protein